jgi:TonB-linked SusC/RagA family outer membrane protein
MKMNKLHYVVLFIFLSVQGLIAQGKMISGKVSSADGSSLPGVNVLVKESGKSASTGFDGSYAIEASKGQVMVFSFIGFANKSVTVGDSRVVNVVMVEESKSLDQVVVVGSTSKVSKKELGNAITSVKSKELLAAQPASLASALQGKVAGAQITQNSGDPAGGFSVKLRGTSSILGSSEPLYVIDGVVMNNSSNNVNSLFVSDGLTVRSGQNRSVDINPNDIETIDVLNGGAAAAIYGSRAANGVIIITTKKGKSGEPKFTFSTSTSVFELRKKVGFNTVNKQFVSTSPVQYTIANSAVSPTTIPVVTTQGTFNLDTKTFDVQRYDYQDDIFRSATGNETYFAVQGGNEKTKYNTSVNYLSNDGIVKNTDFKKIGLRVGLQQELSSKLNMSFGLNYINSFSNDKPDPNVFYSPLNSINITNNIYDLNVRDVSGNLKAIDPGRINPLTVINDIKSAQETDRIIADIQFNYKPFKNFAADFIVGIDNFNTKGTVFIPRYVYPGISLASFSTGYVSETSNKVTQINNDLNLRYVWDITDKFKSTTAGGYNIQFYRDKFTSIEGTDLKPFVENINSFNILQAGSPGSSESKYNLWGFYLQQTFGFANKLFVTGAIRNDASSIFSKDNRYQYYPKVSGSYVLSSEEFMKDSFVSTARLRASWGESGSLTAIGPYSRFTNYTTGSLVGNTTFTIAGNQLGNLDLRPERSVSTEYGIDLGLFKERVTIGFTKYNADIKDLLFNVQLAPSQGANTALKNIGTMNNKGYEISAKIEVIKKENFNFGLNMTYSQNKNEVVDIPGGSVRVANPNSGAPFYIISGQPLGVMFGTYYARNPDGSLLLTNLGLPQLEKGTIGIVNGSIENIPQRDVNGQPTGANLNKVIGDTNPKYLFSVGANLNYKKFGMSILFDGSQGGNVWDADYRTRNNVGAGELAAQELTGELPRGYIRAVAAIEEFRVVDGSYVKLREIAFNYSFGKLSKFFNDLTITASGRNLYSWDKFTSYDPEVSSGGQSAFARYNFGAIPIPKSFTVALKFQF